MGGPVFRRVIGVPWLGAHARACDQLRDLVIRNPFGAVENGHAPIDDVEREMLRPANFRPDHPVQDRDLLGTIEARDLKAPAIRRYWLRRHGASTRPAAGPVRAMRTGVLRLGLVA